MKSSLDRKFWLDPAILISLGILVFLVTAAALGPVLLHLHPNKLSAEQLSPPSGRHWLGTDFLGRDILGRLLAGARISLLVGLAGASISLVIGVSWGAIAAYVGGATDAIMMRIVDILLSLPSLIFIIVLIVVLEKPMSHLLLTLGGVGLVGQARLVLLFVGIGCVEWLTMSRIVRGQVLVIREAQYVQAARVMGRGPVMILWRHILPNLWGLVIICLTLGIPSVILQESFLSFLGLGVQAPSASLGTLLVDGQKAINPIKIPWWMLVFPSSFMALLLLSLNFLGDGLRDALDPRGK